MGTVTRLERWAHQQKAYDETTAAVAAGERTIVVTAPTGSGKTRMQIDLIEWGVEQGLDVALITNRKLLHAQIHGVLQSHDIHPGLIASGHAPALARPVQLCMAQTLGARWGRMEPPKAKLVIVDEVHLQKGGTMQKILDHYQHTAHCIGYTATPLDIEHWDHLIVAATMSDCLEAGCIVPAHTFAPDEPDLRSIKKYKVGVDLSEPDNVKAIMRPGIFGRVFDHWRKLNTSGEPTILFGPDVKGSLWFAEQFWEHGVPAAHIDGEDVWCNGQFWTFEGAREEVLAKVRRGEIPVVCNRFVLREGIDLPELRHGILATVFGSLSSYIQSAGRLLRSHPGKEHAVIQDHGGNWHRFGSVNANREWFLGLTNHRAVSERQERMREHKEPEPRCCAKCHQLRWGGSVCPWCGYAAHGNSRTVVQINGDLREVAGDIYRPRKVREKPDTTKQWERFYYSQRRANRTFNQAYAWFFHEMGYWPPKNLPLMPRSPGDWYSHIRDVPSDRLNASQSAKAHT